ncbi:MAG: phosphatidylserine decarboxylase [Lachnospiraceae bacterium]|nr:phosphatidylserine decarboxylase [Lachnospiraceae bacterium]
MLKFLYETAFGRLILKGLTAPGLSGAVGHFLDTKLSCIFIKPFVKNNGINLDDYYSDNFTCFNDCFCRRVKEDRRPVDMNPSVLVSPCDGLLSAYEITDGLVVPVKQSRYGIADLLGGGLGASESSGVVDSSEGSRTAGASEAARKLAAEFDGGLCLVFRLCVDNYHRYHYFDDGSKGANVFIPGRLHTVRPIALRNLPVFVENAREYTVMDTLNFGRAVQMEVGAMLVGKIANNHEEHEFKRGEEKGCFLYGGSTVILLLKRTPDGSGSSIHLDEPFLANTLAGIETPVKMGQRIGVKAPAESKH